MSWGASMGKAQVFPLRRSTIVNFAVTVTLVFLAGCAVPENFSMYPIALQANSAVSDDLAVVLVGNSGQAPINYLQFGHSSLPAINAKDIDLRPGNIVAIPIAVGIRSLSLQTYTLATQGAGYLPNGMSFGYIAVHTPKIDLTSRGVYYLATVLPGSQPNFTVEPDRAMLAQFAKAYPQIAKLRPVNFTWPK